MSFIFWISLCCLGNLFTFHLLQLICLGPSLSVFFSAWYCETIFFQCLIINHACRVCYLRCVSIHWLMELRARNTNEGVAHLRCYHQRYLFDSAVDAEPRRCCFAVWTIRPLTPPAVGMIIVWPPADWWCSCCCWLICCWGCNDWIVWTWWCCCCWCCCNCCKTWCCCCCCWPWPCCTTPTFWLFMFCCWNWDCFCSFSCSCCVTTIELVFSWLFDWPIANSNIDTIFIVCNNQAN